MPQATASEVIPKCLLHIHMEVSRRLDRLQGANHLVISPSVFYSAYNGISEKHKQIHTGSTLAYLVYELLAEARICGAIYTEFKFNLLRWLDAGLELEDVYESLRLGMARAFENLGILSNAILCIRRDFHPRVVERLVSMICEQRMPGIVGIDLAGDERRFPRCEDFREAFAFAKKNGLKVTVHAGEYGGPENVWFAIEELGADRIGHGLSSMRDEKLLDHMSAEQIMLEVAISSNYWSGVITNLEQHPIRLFLQKGIPTSINTDNPVLLNTDLNKEFELASKLCNLTSNSLIKILDDSIRCSFANEETKGMLFNNIDSLRTRQVQIEDFTIGRLGEGAAASLTKITMESYDKNASGYANYYFGKNVMKDQIDRFFNLLPALTPILDAGCGPGHDSNYLRSKGCLVIGIDNSLGMLREARERVKDVQFLHRSMLDRWEEKYNYFGGIWCCAALLHLTSEQADSALSNFYNLLQTSGILFTSVIRGQGDSFATEERPYGVMRRYFKFYQAEDLVTLLTKNKFKVITVNEEKRWVSCLARKT